MPAAADRVGPPSTAEDSTKDEVQRRQRELEELCAPFAQQLGLVRHALLLRALREMLWLTVAPQLDDMPAVTRTAMAAAN